MVLGLRVQLGGLHRAAQVAATLKTTEVPLRNEVSACPRAAHRPFDGDGRRLTAVNLQLKSQNGNGRVKNGRRRVVRPFAQPFDVYYFFHNFSFVFGYLVDEISDIGHE